MDKAGQSQNPLCLILADDLTGACDAAAPFASRGLLAEVSMVLSAPTGADVFAVNTNSRDLPEREALMHLEAATELLRPAMPAIFLKKLDSVFRGNTFAEIGAMTSLFHEKITLLAPSFPAAGRKVRNGCLFLEDDDRPQLDISKALRSCGINHALFDVTGSVEEKQALLHAVVAEGHRFILCDAETDLELKALTSAGLSLDQDVLWIGSGGLACALAHSLPLKKSGIGPMTPFVATFIFCIGSDHPTMMRQVEHVCECNEVIRIQSSNDGTPAVTAALQRGAHLMLEIGREQTSMDAIRTLLPQLQELPAVALFLSGGDTAMRICEALSTESISLRGELFPGIPWGVMQGGMADGMLVITKSGGFGSRDVLTLLMRMCSRERGGHAPCK
ncbi:MAG TPA: four-carbon acid sugar kinase family protein [Acidobacteriaceae bacterium]|nr:four-carbon acid sugar kinase family protein [Acidobacteriaceae bacterium]